MAHRFPLAYGAFPPRRAARKGKRGGARRAPLPPSTWPPCGCRRCRRPASRGPSAPPRRFGQAASGERKPCRIHAALPAVPPPRARHRRPFFAVDRPPARARPPARGRRRASRGQGRKGARGAPNAAAAPLPAGHGRGCSRFDGLLGGAVPPGRCPRCRCQSWSHS